MSTLNETIEAQSTALDELKKRLVGVQEMLARGQQEQQKLVADIIYGSGKLDGLKEALASKEAESATGKER